MFKMGGMDATDCSFLALHVLSKTEITRTVRPEKPGSYIVSLNCSNPGPAIIFPEVIRIGCGAGLRISNATCSPIREACALNELELAEECLRVPEMAVEYEAQAVFVTLQNFGDESTAYIPIIFERAGDVELRWNLSCPNSTWLTCRSPTTGLLSSGHSRQDLLIQLNAASQPDFSLGGDLTADLSLETYIASRPELPFEGRRLDMRVRARVLARACIEERDVSLLVNDGTEPIPRANMSGRLGFEVVLGSAVLVQLRTLDCARSPIRRHQSLYLSMFRVGPAGPVLVEMKEFVHVGDGVFEMALPTSWVGSEGESLLSVSVNRSGLAEDGIVLVLSLVSSRFPVKLFFVGLIGTGMVILIAVLIALLCNVKNRDQAKQLAKAFVLFELLLAVSLVNADCLSRMAVHGSSL